MTVNPSSTNEFVISDVIEMAYRVAGLMSPNESLSAPDWSARGSVAAKFLEGITKSLQPGGIIARHVVFSPVSIVAGTTGYSVPTSVLTYVGNGAFKETGVDTESPVTPIDRESYQALVDKTTEGWPSMFYLHRTSGTQTLYVFPVPSVSGTLTMQAHQLIADSNVTSYTPDLERHWTMWLVYELAHLLAMSNSLPLPECSRLRGLSEIELEKCKGYSKQSVPVTVRVSHGTGWRC
jgi:hypothetical protein